MFDRRICFTLTVCGLLTALQLGWTQSIMAQSSQLSVTVTDADTGQPLPARLTVVSLNDGQFFFLKSDRSGSGSVVYDKQNWINLRSIERHSTVIDYPASTRLPAGQYRLSVEHGKSYIPYSEVVKVEGQTQIDVSLKRWHDLTTQGWYSGDTHLHRTIDELKNVVLAEDLNVAMPLTNWVTVGYQPASKGDKNIADATRSELITVDPQHLIWPQNTEYEIFSVPGKPHVLGALFVLGHRSQLLKAVPPWKTIVDEAMQQDARVALDMDKLDWPFAMLLPTLVPNALYELANNHVWQTEFAFRDWNSPAPGYMVPPYGAKSGGHRAWLDYTHAMYYSLLNCGLRLPPSAGTANGVHPVPAGFGRVYVQVPGELTIDKWLAGLKAGRSFVTTGPVLMATADGKLPGEVFQWKSTDDRSLEIDIEVTSVRPLLYGEVIINGRPEHLLRPENVKTNIDGVYRSAIKLDIKPTRSGWAAVKFWQPSPDGQARFAHTAPWYFEVDNQPVKPRRFEKEYLVERMKAEIERSRPVLQPEAIEEYEAGLKFYQDLPTYDEASEVTASARPLKGKADTENWRRLFAMHRYTPDEVRAATGLPIERANFPNGPTYGSPAQGLRVVPYPGGRHPRRGFLDGAINPQRETKVSVFPPWDKNGDAGYVVVDVPEAIFSSLGLTYLAHQHIPTIWDQQQIKLEPLEWSNVADKLSMKRRLPNGIEFASQVAIERDVVQMRIQLTNGTDRKLTGLRVQVCTMLSGLIGWNDQEPLESVVDGPVIAVRAANTSRWLLTRWLPNHRVWQNPPVPCIHSDPVFADCEPGKTVEVRGQLWFYEGDDVRSAMTQPQ